MPDDESGAENIFFFRCEIAPSVLFIDKKSLGTVVDTGIVSLNRILKMKKRALGKSILEGIVMTILMGFRDRLTFIVHA